MATAPSPPGLSVGKALREGWQGFRRSPWPFAFFTLFALVLSTAVDLIPDLPRIPRLIGSSLVDLWASVGLIRGAWLGLDGRSIRFGDLIRVNLKELVQVTVAVHRHGDAAGLRQGGLLIDNAHEVEIECSAGQIPENLSLNVTDLGVGGQKTAGDLDLPEGVSLITPVETVLTHIEPPKGASKETADAPTEPEVIAKGGDKSEGEG